jgi:uncharacterized protein YciU (UPF0263 family)
MSVDAEEIFDAVESIFFELASENLDENLLELIDSKRVNLECEISDSFSETWEELLYEKPEHNEYVEVKMLLKSEGQSRCIAMFLLDLDMKVSKECHVQWI